MTGSALTDWALIAAAYLTIGIGVGDVFDRNSRRHCFRHLPSPGYVVIMWLWPVFLVLALISIYRETKR